MELHEALPTKRLDLHFRMLIKQTSLQAAVIMDVFEKAGHWEVKPEAFVKDQLINDWGASVRGHLLFMFVGMMVASVYFGVI